MKRHGLLLLLGASVLAVALVLAMKRTTNVSEPSCGDAASCGSTKGPPAAEALPPTAPTPQRADAPASEAPLPTATDGVALRDEADRLIREGEIREGLDAFRKAVEADPSARNHGDLGDILYRLSAFDEAAIHLRAAAELEPHNADRWIALANVYYRKVDLGEAWKAEKRAREAEPGLELGRDSDGMRIKKGDKARREP